jgi:hypothetical protein
MNCQPSNRFVCLERQTQASGLSTTNPLVLTDPSTKEAPMDRERLDSNIEAIRRYRDAHPALHQAHHFLYDLPLNKDAGSPEVVVMGINPGETQVDRDSCPGPTEETRKHDFHEASASGRSRGSINWRENTKFFANGKPVVFTELFFWSSNDQAEFKKRLDRSGSRRICASAWT